MNDLREHLDRLADAGAAGVDLTRPTTGGRRPALRPRPARAALVVAAGLLVAAVGLAAVLAANGEDDAVQTAADQNDGPPTATVAVTTGDTTFPQDPTPPGDLTLRFLRADGSVVATRSWNEAHGPPGGGDPGRAAPTGGLIQPLPPGDLRLEATLDHPGGPTSCTEPFTVAAGDRLILRMERGPLSLDADAILRASAPCAEVEPVEHWVRGRTGATGAPYVGLPQAEAETRARAEGLTTRVVAIDGVDLAVTMDLRPDRLNLMVFDDVVVAAQLDGEEPVADPGQP